MTSHAKKHHYVPQALLRHFGIDGAGQRIWVLDKSMAKTFPAPITDVACETHFNTLQLDWRLERRCNRLIMHCSPGCRAFGSLSFCGSFGTSKIPSRLPFIRALSPATALPSVSAASWS